MVTLFKNDSFRQYFHKLPDVFKQLSLYSIKLYIEITTSMSLALSISVLFFLFMQPLFAAQFLNINCLSLLFLAASAPAVFATDIVPLTSIYA